jgi:hypothetical protein
MRRSTGLCILTVVFGALATTGCAIGNRYAYHTIVANPTLSGKQSVSVAAHDQRDYVQAGKKSPQFVGLQRGGFGNPFDVRTEGDRPLADDMTTAIVNTLNAKGFRAQQIVVSHTVSTAEVSERLRRTGADRALLFEVKEWKSDVALRIGLTYDVRMSVLGRDGAVLATKRLEGNKEVLGAAGLPSGVGEIVGNAFRTKLELLLDDAAIAAALRDGS